MSRVVLASVEGDQTVDVDFGVLLMAMDAYLRVLDENPREARDLAPGFLGTDVAIPTLRVTALTPPIRPI